KTSIFSHPVYLFLREFSLQDSRGGSYSLAENFCSSNGYTLPRADHLNHSRSRGIGSLYSEWGDMGHYTTEAGFQSNMYWSSSPANSSEQYVVSLATGDQSVFEKLGFAYATCYKNL
ncbi:intimin C-type lectin domain-containing protein, partial [Escherichia coli]|uniref:intimin C-type lectin domain-containing protein n=2 Tax=Escherichia coli TaxID=562 RepID=UPI001C5FAADE